MATHRQSGINPSPPKSNDLEGWREAIAAGQLSKFRLTDLAEAIQDLGPDIDVWIRNSLAKELHDAFFRILRKMVTINHPNRGEDIIYRTIYKLFKALSTPGSCDGNAMRKSCYAVIKKRMIDSIIEERRECRTSSDFFANEQAHETNDNDRYQDGETGEVILVGDNKHRGEENSPESMNEPVIDSSDIASGKNGFEAPLDFYLVKQQEVEVLHLLEATIPNPLKRLAFRLYMEDVPVKTNDEEAYSIAKAVGKDEKTVRLWIKECTEILKAKVSPI